MKKIILSVGLGLAVFACQPPKATDSISPLNNPIGADGLAKQDITVSTGLAGSLTPVSDYIQMRYSPTPTHGVYIFYTNKLHRPDEEAEVLLDGKKVGKLTKNWIYSAPPDGQSPMDGSVLYIKALPGTHDLMLSITGGSHSGVWSYYDIPVKAGVYNPYKFF